MRCDIAVERAIYRAELREDYYSRTEILWRCDATCV